MGISLGVEKKGYYRLWFVRLFKGRTWTMSHMFLVISTREISIAIIYIPKLNIEFVILENMFGIYLASK